MFYQSGTGVSMHPLLLWALGCWICLAEHWSGLLGLQRAWHFRCLGSDCESMRNL